MAISNRFVAYTFMAGIAGAIGAHPVLLGLAFCYGALFGASVPHLMHPNGAVGPHETGLAGGLNGVIIVWMLYFVTLGIAALIVSLIGCVVCVSGFVLLRWVTKPRGQVAVKI